jgi:hypothetical protein
LPKSTEADESSCTRNTKNKMHQITF